MDDILQRNYWLLIQRDEFIRRIINRIKDKTEEVYNIRTEAYSVYSTALYKACSGHEGAQQRDEGYNEILIYLRRIAQIKYPDAVDDVTQSAIEQIYTRFERIRNPEMFLYLALFQLRSAASNINRQNRRENPLYYQDENYVLTQSKNCDPINNYVI